MFIIWGDWFTNGVQSVDTQRLLDSLIVTNKTITRRARVPVTNEVHKVPWRNGERLLVRIQDNNEIQRHYWATSFLLPVGTIFVLALVVLLMVLFKRCPQMVAAIVASVLGVVIIFIALVSINHSPIYV